MSNDEKQSRETHEMRPGDKIINEMTEAEFDKAVEGALSSMKEHYAANMTPGELQTIEVFVHWFKEQCLKPI